MKQDGIRFGSTMQKKINEDLLIKRRMLYHIHNYVGEKTRLYVTEMMGVELTCQNINILLCI